MYPFMSVMNFVNLVLVKEHLHKCVIKSTYRKIFINWRKAQIHDSEWTAHSDDASEAGWLCRFPATTRLTNSQQYLSMNMVV